MKKIAAILLMLMLVIPVCLSLTACGSGQKGNFVIPEEGFLADQDVTIIFKHSMGDTLQAVLNKYIAKFNEIFPKIHVEQATGGGYNDLVSDISTMIVNGDPETPNIAYCYPDHVATYNIANGVIILDDLIESQIEVKHADDTTETLGFSQKQLDDFIPGYYGEGKSFGDDLMYLLPFSKSTELMYYNKTFFTKHNIPIPDHWFSTDANDKTSMESVCRLILEKAAEDGIEKVVPLGLDSEDNLFITLCKQMNTGYTDYDENNHYIFDNQQNRETLKKLRQMYVDGLFTTKEITKAYTSELFKNTDSSKMRSYISIGSSAGAGKQVPTKDADGNYPFEVGIASIPQQNASNKKVISQGPDVCLLKNDDPQKVLASWLLIKYLTTNPEFQAEFALAQGYAPVINSAYSVTALKNRMDNADGGDNIVGLGIKQCLAQKDLYFTSPVFDGSSNARLQVKNLVVNVIGLSDDDLDNQIKKSFENALQRCLQAN